MQSCLGQRVKELRKSLGFTQEYVAKKIGHHVTYISRVEIKGFFPSMYTIQKIADVLGTTVNYLLAMDEVSETSASDAAFFRKYKKMDSAGKEKVRKMCEIL